MSSLKELFGASLRHARKAKALSQQQLAEMSGLSVDMVSRVERGDVAPSFDTIEVLAKALGVTPSRFFGMNPMDLGRASKRTRALSEIHRLLSRANDGDVIKVARILSAYFAD